MSINRNDFIKAIESFAPESIQEPWDNSGWQIDLGGDRIARVLVALEIVRDTVSEAVKEKADIILTHHPLFFVPMKNISTEPLDGEYAVGLIEAGISVYSAHTSFDAAQGGMNDTLAEKCGLLDIEGFYPDVPLDVPNEIAANGKGAPMARRGVLPETIPFGEYAKAVAKAIGMEGSIKTVGRADTPIRTVAVCGGGGGDYISGLIGKGIDLYITSDIKHHQAQWAAERGLCLIDGGHYGTEHHFEQVCAARLREAFGDALEVIETSVSTNPFNPLL